MGTLRVRGTAECRFPADIFTVHIEVLASGETSGAAIAAGKEQTELLLSRMQERLGLQPDSFRLQDESVRQTYGEKPCYQFTKGISAEIAADLAALERMTELLGTLSETEYHISYALSDLAGKEQQVLRSAVEDSRRRAEMIAAAVGQKICGIEDVNCEYAGGNDLCTDRMLAKCEGAVLRNGLADRLMKPEQTVSKEVQIVWRTE